MTEYVEIEVEPGLTMTVEARQEWENVLVDAGRTKDVATATLATLSSTLDGIRAAAASAMARFCNMENRPSELSVEFSVQLAAEAGVVIASTAATANMSVAVKWVDLNHIALPKEQS
jgi:hypothetical protein